MMQAQVIKQFGSSSIFETMEIPKPQLKPGHVLIRVMATSVNPVDYKIRSGKIPTITAPFPAILHGDVAGIIEEVSSDVTDFKKGDEVFGCAGGAIGSDGALAEFMSADARFLAKKPNNLSMAEAAALPLVSLTAWEGLFEKVNIKSGQKVLVHAGTGGVGHIAIQLAKWAGADVYATVSSAEKAQIAKSLGATDVINYHEESVSDYVKRITQGKGFDIVFDTVGGKNIDTSMEAISLYGHVITIEANHTANLIPLHLKSGSLHCVLMLIPLLFNLQRERHGKVMARIAELVEQKKLKPLIDENIFSFAEVGQAHALLESGKAIGKVVITR